MRFITICASLIALAIPATAVASAPHKPTTPHPQIMSSPPDMGAFLAIFDKLFPPQPDPDPARLAQAKVAVASLWADGSYMNIMTGMMGNVFDGVMKLKESDLPGPKGKKAAATGGPELSLHDQAIAKDPYFDQRAAAIRQVIVEEGGKISAIIDPRIRVGLARSMARRFDARQLADINAFFATPSGHALASQYIQMWVDPDALRAMMGAMPEIVKLMPDMMQKVKAASDKFPPPPKSAKTSPAPHAKS